MRRALASLVLAVVLGGCAEEEDEQNGASLVAMESLISFARAPNQTTWASMPLADSVGLGLGETIRVRRTPQQLREPSAWRLDVDLFRGRAGMASALDLIASERGALRVTEGPHPHCASRPVAAPPLVSDLHRVVVQPRDADGCLDWWTVDVFVNADGEIQAVTLDLWEP